MPEGTFAIEDHGLIGDGCTAALVRRDGVIDWLCAPRFDSEPLFAGILDPAVGGHLGIRHPHAVRTEQRYIEGTAVLVTEIEGREGRLRITDALLLRGGTDLSEDAPTTRGELLRRVEALGAPIDVEVDISFFREPQLEGRDHEIELQFPQRDDLNLGLLSSKPLPGLRATVPLEPGERLDLVLSWEQAGHRHRRTSADEALHDTVEAWKSWTARISYRGPRAREVHRSAITLKVMDHPENGAIVAAPTSSLPEVIGGERNWDYRYSWIRDAAFSVYALHRIGLVKEARGFLGWVLDAVERYGPKALFTLGGDPVPAERLEPALRGYRDSRPVRWGNAAGEQVQQDLYGEILDCAYQWWRAGADIDAALWKRLRPLIESAGREWPHGGQGIWEVRTVGRPFTYSAGLCHVALTRGARIANETELGGDVEDWNKTARRVREAILRDAWDDEVGAIAQHLHGDGGLDASVLALPLRRVVPSDHPKMIATCRAIADRLGAGDGLLYRYLVEDSPDGLVGGEGAFLLCSFWMVDNLAWQGEVDEAMELYESLCRRTNHVGLLPEEIDPSTGAFLGNFPQAFSHVGVISSGYNLARLHPDWSDGKDDAGRDPMAKGSAIAGGKV